MVLSKTSETRQLRRKLANNRYFIGIPDAAKGTNLLAVRTLKNAGKFLGKKYGKRFVSVVLFGSRTKGYASSVSDVDLHLVVNGASNCTIGKMSSELESIFADSGLRASVLDNPLDVKCIPSDVASVHNERPYYVSPIAERLALIFGLAYGQKINAARISILKELEKLPKQKSADVWRGLNRLHEQRVLFPNARKMQGPAVDIFTRELEGVRAEKFGLHTLPRLLERTTRKKQSTGFRQ